ncbi:hypothetical protein QAD02_019604 [Eretmocerus hayati]|uniref:Uncharacterized protein n=1 Tax=Eretmocerus hayati TaxID=131215 RepID=A0ACC2PKA8_9HYME|nr:hypothetical protein QAD02_019604 [Eretmocerus hayati]
MPAIITALSLLFFTGTSTAQLNSTSIVLLRKGPVRGQILTTFRKSIQYSSFTGIPFAKPPLADLRFRPPEEIENWKDVLDTTKEPSICAQLANEINSRHDIIGSEDCLYLNVYTPQTDFERLNETDLKAVMVWIYGGGFMAGSQLSNTARPDFLLENDVVVVSMNYRLGPLGFLNLNHQDASGNAGLKDQSLALRWVKENIAQFGGNPKKITIFGESAGAVSVDLHVVSNMSVGLFQQSISMSGSPLGTYWSMQTNKEAMQHAFELGSKLGYNFSEIDGLLETLRSASTADLIVKAAELPWTPFRPTVEKNAETDSTQKFLSSCVLDRYKDVRKINRGRHMMGFTSNEGKVFYYNMRTVLDMFEMSSELFEEGGISMNLSSYQEFASLLEKNLSNSDKDQLQQNLNFFSGMYFVAGIDQKQQVLRKANDEPIYYYRFAFEATKYMKDEKQNQRNYRVEMRNTYISTNAHE